MLILAVSVSAPAGQIVGIKEQIAMELEVLGRVEISRVEIDEHMKLNIIALIDRLPGAVTSADLETIRVLDRNRDMKVISKRQIEPEQLTLLYPARNTQRRR